MNLHWCRCPIRLSEFARYFYPIQRPVLVRTPAERDRGRLSLDRVPGLLQSPSEMAVRAPHPDRHLDTLWRRPKTPVLAFVGTVRRKVFGRRFPASLLLQRNRHPAVYYRFQIRIGCDRFHKLGIGHARVDVVRDDHPARTQERQKLIQVVDIAFLVSV